MIVNPPRSESDLSPRLRSIAVHAADKLEDPADRPRRIPVSVWRWTLIIGSILLAAGLIRGGLWFLISHPEFSTQHAQLAETYRRLARNSEAEAIAIRQSIKNGRPAFISRVGLVSDPVRAEVMAAQLDALTNTYRRQAVIEEALNQGFATR